MNKKQIISKINKVGIQDILCTSVQDEGYAHFCLEIRTKDGNSFHFVQNLVVEPKFENLEVIYFDETGNGKTVEDLGKGFNPKTYKRAVSNKASEQQTP